MSEDALRDLICDIGRRLYARNLATATDGNISTRLGDNRYLITRSGVSKGYLTHADVLVADGSGALLEGSGKVSSEFTTHLAVYEERPDAVAVVHAHPPYATALTLAGVSLCDPVLPEFVMALGGAPTTPYATPGTPEGGDQIRLLAREADAIMLDRHGAVTLGESLLDAYYKMEKLEHAAETLHHALALGSVKRLSRADLDKLFEARKAYGATGKVFRV
ncbi:MAG: class II aldolase/adducin family protein [Candidatus Hydrogenedens sp.]|nr:class II aldolase/adducin family protein [Candidatus Hydrogenedens sp.]